MDDGFLQFLFLVVVAILWIAEAAASSRRRKKQQEEQRRAEDAGEVELPGGWELEWEDEEPESAPPPRRQTSEKAESYQEVGYRTSAGEGNREDRPRTSEGMLPRDLWEEIAAIARGEAPARKPPSPPKPLPTRTEPAYTPPPPREVPVHQRRADRVPAPGRRISATQHAADRRPSKAAPEVRDEPFVRAFGARGSRGGLRRAVILREILGPPRGFRSDEHLPPYER